MIGITLAEKFKASKIDNWEDWAVSEKFDGVRAVWDGKTLWTRNGEKIHAPAFWTKGLPKINWEEHSLDGELTMGRGTFDQTSGAVRRHEPDSEEWKEIRFKVFDVVTGQHLWLEERLNWLHQMKLGKYVDIVEHFQVSNEAELKEELDKIASAGGEGLMMKSMVDDYKGWRTDDLLKVKKAHDAEAVVCGHVEGTGRNSGRLGALLCELPDGQTFRCGGMTDEVRNNPPDVGSTITYLFDGLTPNGKPRFPRFLRERICA